MNFRVMYDVKCCLVGFYLRVKFYSESALIELILGYI